MRDPGSSYLRLWRSVPRELGFLVLTLPVALVGFTVTLTLFVGGVGSIWTFFLGVVLAIVALYASRAFGAFELVRLSWAGRPPIERPEWQDTRARQGFFGWLRSVLGNGHYWLYLLHTMVVVPIVALVTWSITVTWVATALRGVTTWIPALTGAGERGWQPFDRIVDGAEPGLRALGAVGAALLGLLLLALLPFVTRGLVLVHELIARGMLGAFRSDALQRRLIATEVSRGAAVSAEDQSLRRLERDLHDGPQQRLVRLQMDLAAAERQLDADPERARITLAGAREQSREALAELRSLSRGFAPPVLLDRGLVAALESAATRSSVPARVVSDLPDGMRLPQETERGAYFVGSECLVNVVKHAGATGVEVRLHLDEAPEPGVPGVDAWLELEVTDDGHGGAVIVPGHGLAGLEERCRGLGGRFQVTSPAGGPTVVRAAFPLVRGAGAA